MIKESMSEIKSKYNYDTRFSAVITTKNSFCFIVEAKQEGVDESWLNREVVSFYKYKTCNVFFISYF